MKPELKVWHMESVAEHKQWLYVNLLYPHHLVTTMKEISFSGMKPVRGYFAKKDRIKYWVDRSLLEFLPVRIGDQNEDLIYNEDVVVRPLNPKPFRITAAHKYDARTLVDMFAPFAHTRPEHWLLLKVAALMGYIGRTYVCVSSPSEFGKSSVYDLIHGLTDLSPVFKPRSVPGVLNHINGTGNVVFDEAHRCDRKTRDIMEEFSLQIGGGKSVYINGALRSQGTKDRYPCSLQSITYLYNNVDNYADPCKDYFEYIFSNNKAIDTRFLKLKLDGILTEKFDRKFDVPGTACEFRHIYLDFAKELLYLQELKQRDGYKRRWTYSPGRGWYRGRRRQVFDELTWFLDMYCETQEEYGRYVSELVDCVDRYRDMVSVLELPDGG